MELDLTRLESLCKEREEKLLKGYFYNLVEEAAHERPEFTGKYTPDLPYKVESEYREYLAFLLKQLFPEDETIDVNCFLDEEKLRKLITEDDSEIINEAYKKASKRTF